MHWSVTSWLAVHLNLHFPDLNFAGPQVETVADFVYVGICGSKNSCDDWLGALVTILQIILSLLRLYKLTQTMPKLAGLQSDVTRKR